MVAHRVLKPPKSRLKITNRRIDQPPRRDWLGWKERRASHQNRGTRTRWWKCYVCCSRAMASRKDPDILICFWREPPDSLPLVDAPSGFQEKASEGPTNAPNPPTWFVRRRVVVVAANSYSKLKPGDLCTSLWHCKIVPWRRTSIYDWMEKTYKIIWIKSWP